jgi:hypothetical protein
VYFNDPKVKAVIHAPADVEWTECAAQSVFVAPGDTSLPSSYEVLPRVIAHGARTVVVAGLADFVLISEGWAGSLSTRTFSLDSCNLCHFAEPALRSKSEYFSRPPRSGDSNWDVRC